MAERPFYSITIGEKNTWDDFHLMPVGEGRIDFATPELKYESVSVPGSDGELDLTEALTGFPTYKSRKGTLKFRFFDDGKPARNKHDDLKNYLHGRWMRAIIDDQPEYYYEGRFTVGDLTWARKGNWAETEISYTLDAYKLEVNTSLEDWLWNPFNFETGVIREYAGISVSGEETVTVTGSRKPTVPRFIVDGTLIMEFNGISYALTTGTVTIPQILLIDQEYEFTFRGSGTVSIDMRAGIL